MQQQIKGIFPTAWSKEERTGECYSLIKPRGQGQLETSKKIQTQAGLSSQHWAQFWSKWTPETGKKLSQRTSKSSTEISLAWIAKSAPFSFGHRNHEKQECSANHNQLWPEGDKKGLELASCLGDKKSIVWCCHRLWPDGLGWRLRWLWW